MRAAVRGISAVCAALLVPPAWIALGGGADLDVALAGGRALRLVWYDPVGAPCALAVALAGAMLRPRVAGRFARALLVAYAALLVVATWAAVGDGLDVGWLSARYPLRPSLAAALALAGALRGGLARVAWRPAAAALAAGALATASLVAADRADLRARVLRGEPAAAGRPPATSTRAPDVLLIVVDTLRADALANAAADAPHIAALAGESLVFERAFSNAAWTLPSMMALYASRHPSTIDPRLRGSAEFRVPLAADLATLPSALAARGYHTAGFVKNPVIAPGSGFERGYDVYEWVGGEDADGQSARQLVDAVLRWARVLAAAREGGEAARPWFAHVHFMDPHVHYRPPRAYWSERARAYDGEFDGHARTLHRMTRDGRRPGAGDVAQMKELYAGEVRYLDAQVGRLLDALRALGLLDGSTIVAFTADHGEQFGEHGGFEHRDLNVENVAVPLLLRAPGLAPGRRAEPAGLVDVAPTLLALAGAGGLDGAEGRDLLASPGAPPRVVSEFGGKTRITDGRYALVADAQGAERFFDLEVDPREQRVLGGAVPLDAAAARARAQLRAALERHRGAARARAPAAAPPRHRRTRRARARAPRGARLHDRLATSSHARNANGGVPDLGSAAAAFWEEIVDPRARCAPRVRAQSLRRAPAQPIIARPPTRSRAVVGSGSRFTEAPSNATRPRFARSFPSRPNTPLSKRGSIVGRMSMPLSSALWFTLKTMLPSVTVACSMPLANATPKCVTSPSDTPLLSR
ncbi:MAG: sulfatase [Myxococcota bacterium]